ncbi:MAG TPA: penicillin-binding protein 2 [Verrucomicrobiae bacterium]|jgi:cell division protein FtsI/penicillin-binding protein 2
MNNKLLIKRALLLLTLVSLAFAGLGFRLMDLQVLRHDELSKLADDNTHRDYWEVPRRGDILDINGNVLATSSEVKTICADPTLIGNQQAVVAHTVAPWLQMDEAAIYQKLLPRAIVFKNDQGQLTTNISHYVRLARNVSPDVWLHIRAAMTNLTFGVDEKKLSRNDRRFFNSLRSSAVFAETDQKRTYPNGSLASQVIGFSGVEESKVGDRTISKIVGRDGIEWAMNTNLFGVAGWRVTETDRAQRELVSMRDQDVAARDGMDVVLTLDSVVQHIVETALADAIQKHTPKSITGIVMRPRTGEILAMATLPTFDPNQPGTITPETRNRVITDVIEPGSVFKIVVVSGALNNGTIRLTDQFDCERGHFAFAGHVLHDHEPYGILSTIGIITKSSNIGAAKIGIKLGEQSLYDYAWNYGFGQRTGIPLPGEGRGFLYPVKDWSKVSIAQIPMGHGVAVTRLQMIMAMAAIANHGWLMRPMIVSRLQEHDGTLVQQYAPQRVRQVVSDNTCREMIEALKTVATKEGTAEGAAMKNYVVAGKTGTAQKAENGAYVPGKFISSFIGFFPADDPQICISIVMDEPKEGYYGGKVCGPVFKDIAERCASYLNIPGDPSLMQTNLEPMVAEKRIRKN